MRNYALTFANIVLSYKKISSHFGMRRHPIFGGRKLHKGTDFAAPEGTPVHAIADGYISRIENKKGYGNVVYIKHDNGMESLYAHLSKFADINPDQRIHAGEEIGNVGSTGFSTGPHLHFEVRDKDGNLINPELVLSGQMPVNPDLLPKDDALNTADAFEAEKRKQPMDTLTFSYTGEAGGSSFKNPIARFFSSLFSVVTGWFDSEPAELKTVDLNLSKENLLENGFTVEEIDRMAQLKLQKETAGLTETLENAGRNITSEDLRMAGLEESKIEMLNSLAQRKQTTA